MTVVDASAWVSALLVDDVHHITSRRWLDQRIARGDRLFGPRLLSIELAGAIARRTGKPSDGMGAVIRFRRVPNVRLIAVDDRLETLATRLAAELRLRGADALYVAVAYDLGLPLITWDREIIQRAGAIITVQTPI